MPAEQPPISPRERPPERVPVEELVDLDLLRVDGQPPSARRIRAALPRGWVLEEDGRHARRDLRLFFREAWILLVGLFSFGSVALFLFWSALPRDLGDALRFLALLGGLLLVGDLVAPIVTRALYRKEGGRKG